MRLTSAIDLNKQPQKPGKPFSVIDSKYGFLVSRWDTYAEANKAATMRPYSKVVSSKYVTGPGAADTRKVRP